MHWALAVFVVLLYMVDIIASIITAWNPLLSGSQRVAQLALIWLVPVVGAVFCLVFRATMDRAESPIDRQAFVDIAGDDGMPVSLSLGESLCEGDATGGDGGSD